MVKNILEKNAKKPSPLPKKLKRSEQEINRLQALIAQGHAKIKKQSRSARKARTRTLIQVGGNALKAGLLDACSIETGEDLQDPKFYDKAALLVGFIQDALDSSEFTDKNIEEWRRRGEITLRYEFAKEK